LTDLCVPTSGVEPAALVYQQNPAGPVEIKAISHEEN
jgi:hypothetical protein